MACTIAGAVLLIIVMAVILAVLLQVASKLVIKEAIDFGEAFKTAIVASVLTFFIGIGLRKVFTPEQALLLFLVTVATTYIIWVLALSIIVDLTLSESLLVGAVFTIIKLLVEFVLLAILASLLPGGAN